MSIRTRFVSLVCALSLITSIIGSTTVAASAQTQATAPITGLLIDQAGGVAIANATITLIQGAATRIAQTTSAADGTFAFPAQAPGFYHIEIRAEGYSGIVSDSAAVTTGSAIPKFRVALQRSSTGSTTLKEIGRVTTASGRSQVSTSTTITQTLDSDLVIKEGYNRIGDALGTLPGVNLSGLSSSIGDDLGINIRGFGTSETQTLIDGHPVGQFGPGSGGYSFQNSPAYAIGRTVVTVGSGALGLYGTDSIGGTIDMQTLEPTPGHHYSVTQGVGNFGTLFTNFTATGTLNQKFGYAIDHAAYGTYGPYKPAQRYQAAAAAATNDFSDANVAANTYETSGNYNLRNDLLKVRYNFDDKTALTASFLSANSWDDKSGNGDNCYNSVAYQTYVGNGIVAGGPNTFTGANGTTITCNGSVAVNLNSGPACVNVNQYANISAGLVPGGPGPWQAHRLDDYHARLTHTFGINNVTVDGFKNRASTDYNRNTSSAATDANGKFLFFNGGFSTGYYDTTGVLISDDISTNSNDFGFGYYVQHQRIFGNTYNYDPMTAPNGAIVPTQEYASGQSNFFVRDVLNGDKNVSYYLNAWSKRSTVTNKTTFDPRLSVVIRATPSDVIRLTGGHSDGEPSPNLLYGPPNFNTTPTNFSPLGTPPYLLSVGSSSNANLLPESSNDFELAIGHRFKADSIIQIDLYESFEKNRIFGGLVGLASTGVLPSSFLLQQYYNQLQLLTGKPANTFSVNDLGVSTQFNAAGARFQGIELNGRTRVNPHVYLDYTYDLQSADYIAVPDAILKKQATVINNAQLSGLPLHRYNLALGYNDLRGLELRIDGYYVGDNNQYGRPAFTYANGTISKDLGRHTNLNIGVQNIFNSASSTVSAIGIAPIVATNQFNPYSIDRQINFGTTGLLPVQVTGSVTFKI